MNAKQLLLRGAYLRNTDWVLGVVVYSGQDTKIMRNAESPKIKVSYVENEMNKHIIGIFLVQLLLCFITALLTYFWGSINNDKG